jgi:His-Xaa-Ser system protein HxsD
VAELVVSFDCATQELGPLREAAYRLIGTASYQVERINDRYDCRLQWADGKIADADGLRLRFLDLVTDENLRAKLARETEPTRNLILALAFGAIAASESTDGA